MLKAGFQPTRKVVLAFGFDEETSGLHVSLTFISSVYVTTLSQYQGAYEIGKYLESTYGEDAFAMIVDEGGEFQILRLSLKPETLYRRIL